MGADSYLAVMPLWSLFTITFVLVLLSVLGGRLIGSHFRKRMGEEGEGPVGSAVGASLGLLAFMLAFTFGIASNRYETRKELLLDDVNAIRTAFVRADFLPEPDSTEVRRLFRDYVHLRADRSNWAERGKQEQAIINSDAMLDNIWSHTVTVANRNSGSETVALFIESVNEVRDYNTKRVTIGLRTRIPQSIWLALFFVSILAMGSMGYQFGLTGSKSLVISILLALTFSIVMWLIADIDRGLTGAITINQGPMLELKEEIDESVP